MSVAHRIARNASALALSQGATLALNFVTWAYLARTLEPSGFGILGFGTAMLAYFSVIVQLGFDAVVVREGARDLSRLPALAGQLLALRLLLCAVALAVYSITVLLLPRPPLYQITLLILGVQLIALATRLNWVFQATERMGQVALRDTLVAVLNAIAVVVLVRRPDQIVVAAAITTAAPLAGNVWLFSIFRKQIGRLRLSFDRQAWLALLRPAIPLAASALMIEIYVRLDQVMLEFLYSTDAVGLYSAAYRLVSVGQLPANIAFSVFFPSVAAALGTPSLMRERGRMVASVLLPVGLALAVAGPWVARDAMVLAYGPAYASAGPALAVLLVNAGVIHVSMALGMPLMAWDLQKPYMWAVLGGAVMNVILNFALIPSFGMLGASVATLASEATVCVGLGILYYRTTGDLPVRALLRGLPVALAAAVPAAGGSILGWPVPVSVVLSLGSAALVAWKFGIIDPSVLRRPPAPPTVIVPEDSLTDA